MWIILRRSGVQKSCVAVCVCVVYRINQSYRVSCIMLVYYYSGWRHAGASYRLPGLLAFLNEEKQKGLALLFFVGTPNGSWTEGAAGHNTCQWRICSGRRWVGGCGARTPHVVTSRVCVCVCVSL